LARPAVFLVALGVWACAPYYAAALSARAAAPETGRAFIAFVARPSFKAKFAAAGLDYRE
jgi:hypothetical protein